MYARQYSTAVASLWFVAAVRHRRYRAHAAAIARLGIRLFLEMMVRACGCAQHAVHGRAPAHARALTLRCVQRESAGSSTRRSTSSGRLCPTSSAPQSERHSCRCCIRVARVHAHASAHHPPKLARSPQRAGRHMLQQIATTAPSALSGAAARTGDNFVMGRGCSACRWDTSRQLKVKVRLACDVRYAACWAPGGAGLRSA
jgi:hypothetical protein